MRYFQLLKALLLRSLLFIKTKQQNLVKKLLERKIYRNNIKQESLSQIFFFQTISSDFNYSNFSKSQYLFSFFISLFLLYSILQHNCFNTPFIILQTSMGSSLCASRVEAKRKPEYSEYPEDIKLFQQLHNKGLPKIKFNALLSNIKIVNCTKNAVSLKFEIEQLTEVFLPRKSVSQDSNQIKWVRKETFDFVLDQYELRLKFLEISITDDQGKTKNCLKINLYQIATGPYHNDFSIFGKQNCRLKFDFKLSQYVQMNVICEETLLELYKKQLPGQKFYFTLRVIRQERQQPFQSAPSYSQTIPLLNQQNREKPSSQYDQCPSPIKIKGSSRMNISNFMILWSKQKGSMPNFSIFLRSNQIQKTILHLIIWRDTDSLSDNQESSQSNDDADMFCQAYTPVVKILQKDPIFIGDKTHNIKIEERMFSLKKEGLWSDKEKVGQFSMKIKVTNNFFIKQMKACTRTETGIIESMPFFSKYAVNNKKEKKFIQIQNAIKSIDKFNKEMNESSSYHSQRLKDLMVEQFKKIKIFFQNDLEKSYIVVDNSKQLNEMMDDQTLLLSLVHRIIIYAEDDQSLNDVCWRIVLYVMKRGQFNLNNIGFSKNDQSQMSTKITPILKRKIKIGLEYQQILYKLLLLSLRVGYIEGRQDPRQAVQMFRAFAYFRVPEYRQLILQKVSKKYDSTIQWNTHITDSEVQKMPEAQNILSLQIDWQNSFYKPLSHQSKSQVLTKQMVESLEGSLWIEQISKRGSTFFYFLYFLISKLSELGKRIKFLKWQYFPGYNKLIRAFLYQMKNKKISNYPPTLIQTSINLLANERLLNILITMTIEKTDLNDCNGLMKSLDLISRYLNYFTKSTKHLPTSFNYVSFFKALKIILERQFAYSIIKTLGIIYTNFDNFNIEFRRNLALYLMGKVFFKLFLNWSFSVRKSFYHILILKVQRASDIFDPDSRKQFSNKHELMMEIATRYEQCIKIVKNAAQINKEDRIAVLYKNDKELYKQLKRKLHIKKKKGNQSSQKKQTKESYIRYNFDFEHFGKEETLPFNNKYSLLKLIRSEDNERSYSVTLDTNIIKYTVDIARKQSVKDNKSKFIDVETDDVSRTKSGTTTVQIQYQSQKDSNLLMTKGNKKNKQRKRSIYGIDEFQIKQIEKKQIDYLPIALKQFEDLDDAIRKYYLEYNKLPQCELDVEVPIDEKQIKPGGADFQEWQSNQNSEES